MMPWGHNPLVWLSALLAVTALGSTARAQSCASARPTESGATQGLSYGDAELAFFDSTSGRARVHFALSGTHAPPAASTLESGVPDAVVVAAQAAEDALDTYSKLGYQPPLGDGDSPCGSNGDSGAIDIYLIQFAGADGQASLDHCQAGTPKRCAGFVLVENDFHGGGYRDTAEGMRTVVPHELFHLVQDGYDADVERWWAEGSAQWAGKQVYPELRDLERFLPGYFDNPWRPLNVPPSGVITDFLYATAIWPVFLQQRYDASLVREVYEGFRPGAEDVLSVTDEVLSARGNSLAHEFLQFAAYNAATGSRAPQTGGYVDAAQYPQVDLKLLESSRGELARDVASGLGAFYYSLTAGEPSQLTLEATPERVAALFAPVVDGRVELADAKPLPTLVHGEGVVVVAGQTLERTDAPFTLLGQAPAGSDGAAGKSAGCSLAPPTHERQGYWSMGLGFVVSWAGRWRARQTRRRPRS
jgi:hypothetical protein